MQRIDFALPLLIAILLIARLFFLSQTPSFDARDRDTVAQSSQLIASGNDSERVTETDDMTVVASVFDPTAIVVLTPGPDGKPGQAGIDDGGNGTTDERGELGATGSDDVCQVIFGEEADAEPREDGMIVQRGAFRPLLDGEGVPDGTPVRDLVRWTDHAGRVHEMLRDR